LIEYRVALALRLMEWILDDVPNVLAIGARPSSTLTIERDTAALHLDGVLVSFV
jgi:hypothetical protein